MLWSDHEGVEVSQGWGYDHSRGHDVRSSLQLVMSFSFILQIQYSGSSNTKHLNSQPIQNQSVSGIVFEWLRFLMLCTWPTIQKQNWYQGDLKSDQWKSAQVVINCRFSIAQMRTWEEIHARLFIHAVFDDVMSQSELTTIWIPNHSTSEILLTIQIPNMFSIWVPKVVFCYHS